MKVLKMAKSSMKYVYNRYPLQRHFHRQNTRKMQTFQFVIDACAELLEKTHAKSDRATFVCSEHLKHSRKYMQNALSTAASPQKALKTPAKS